MFCAPTLKLGKLASSSQKSNHGPTFLSGRCTLSGVRIDQSERAEGNEHLQAVSSVPPLQCAGLDQIHICRIPEIMTKKLAGVATSVSQILDYQSNFDSDNKLMIKL